MKKLLAIMVLGLLWSNVGLSDDVIKFECNNPKFQIQEMFLDKKQKKLSSIFKYKDKYYNEVVKKRAGSNPQMSNPVFKVTYLDDNTLKYKAGSNKIDFNYNTDGKVLFKDRLLHTCNKVSFAAKPKKEPKPKTVAKKPETTSLKEKILTDIRNLESQNKEDYYFFAFTSGNKVYYGAATNSTPGGGNKIAYVGSAKGVNYKTGKFSRNCKIHSSMSTFKKPFKGTFKMNCPGNRNEDVQGSWSQPSVSDPGIGSGFNLNGDQVSVFFSLNPSLIISAVSNFKFGETMLVKKKPEKNITKSSDIDTSLITIGSGSGFYINNKGYALTNNHVIDICAQSVAVIDGKETLFRVIATDKINDVAVLKTDYKSRNYIKINEDGAKLGENVIAVGYPLAGRLSDSVKITRGIVSSTSGLDNNIGQIQIDAALQPGNSGGPVLNEKGDLIGIASAGLNKLLMAKEAKYIPENVNFAVASPIVVNILKSKKVKYTTPSIFSGSYSNTELAELGDSSTIQLFCRNTRTAYNRLKSSNKYSTVLLDLD